MSLAAYNGNVITDNGKPVQAEVEIKTVPGDVIATIFEIDGVTPKVNPFTTAEVEGWSIQIEEGEYKITSTFLGRVRTIQQVTIAASGKVSNIDTLTTMTGGELDAANDYIVVYDASAGEHKKLLVQDLP